VAGDVSPELLLEIAAAFDAEIRERDGRATVVSPSMALPAAFEHYKAGVLWGWKHPRPPEH
jgi:hypothetical protein